MTYQQALDYISTISARGSKPGLERIRTLMDGLGNVQNQLRFVHIAGTNGKGSTSCMLSGILTEAGYKTGLFISPFVVRFNERMQVDGRYIPDDTLAEIVEQVKAVADTMPDGATEFELITAVAFLWFAREQCDIVVLETGLGGRLDATNLIATNECAVITNLGMDHTDYLGNTLGEIAYEKACILKPHRPVAVYASEQEALDVIVQYALDHGNDLRITDFSALEPLSADLTGQTFRYRGEPYAIRLLGAHQQRNAALVLETVQVLRDLGWQLPDEAVRAGMAKAQWPARFELLCQDPIVFVDGAHNMQGVEALCKAVADYLGGRQVICLTGVLADKDWQHMMAALQTFSADFITVTPDSPRALGGEALAQWLTDCGCVAHSAETVAQGLDMALAKAKAQNAVVVACGSLYMASEIRAYFGRNG